MKNKLRLNLLLLRRKAGFWRDLATFDLKLKRNTPVLVYQMGKVGSSSIRNSLKRVYPGLVLHAHKFPHNHQDPRVRKLREVVFLNRKPINLISLTREPIGRNISDFFQKFEQVTGSPYSNSRFSLTELVELFLENYSYHDVPLNWFDKQVKRYFDIDVYATPFPACGIATYSQENVRLLVMRSELSDEVKVSAISEFLGIPKFKLVSANVGLLKEYADTYRLFKEKAQLPSNYINRMYESKYFNHFYTKDIVELVRQQWKSPCF